ncbi:MAG TPA: hypothetical protein VK186_25220 [Candidatus Deferrimicrobium sp.]|nr:hypothetical protein [Candidatus Kapabacteria bacterium]HLP62167.1 hypothetical protein [Candidatus Deferrimicrobium sp.]
MKKKNIKSQETDELEMLPEYDFKNGIRGKHYKAYRKGHNVIIHKIDGSVTTQYFKLEDGAVMIEPDVRKYFPDSDSVNKALRSLIELFPGKKSRRTLSEKVL